MAPFLNYFIVVNRAMLRMIASTDVYFEWKILQKLIWFKSKEDLSMNLEDELEPVIRNQIL